MIFLDLQRLFLPFLWNQLGRRLHFPTYPCVKEYIRHHIVAGQKINDDLKVGGVVFTEGEFIVPDRFKNQTVLPVIERLKQSSLMNDDLKRTTDLLRGSFGVVQPNVIRVNESI
jgi:hypothetical protein